jgi:hypothetical protein
MWAQEDFLFWVDYGFWGGFLCFWRSWIDLTRFLGSFLGVLGKKMVWNWVFWLKKQELYLFDHHNGWILGNDRRRVIYQDRRQIIFFFLSKNGDNITSKNIKGPHTGAELAGLCPSPFLVGQILGCACQAHNTWPYSFF